MNTAIGYASISNSIHPNKTYVPLSLTPTYHSSCDQRYPQNNVKSSCQVMSIRLPKCISYPCIPFISHAILIEHLLW